MKTQDAADLDLLASLIDELFRVSKSLWAVVAEVLVELDITIPLADALWQLDPAAPPPSMRQLAAGLRCDPSTVTFLADRLVERGLVDVRVDPSDRRRKTISLTTKGGEARQRLVAALATGSALARLSQDGQRQLHALLRQARSMPPPEDAAADGRLKSR